MFVGTFTAGDLVIGIEDGRLRILQEGRARKFVDEVEHRTFSGEYAWKRRQRVLYITERCVFRLGPEGLELVEIAPGIDLERDILAHMDFVPVMKSPPRPMDARIFREEPMGLREQLLDIPLDKRLTYDTQENVLFINFERLHVRSTEDVDAVRRAVEAKLKPIGKKVYAIVNYDNFSLAPEAVDAYAEMVRNLVRDYYWDVTRYSTSSFLRMKLGDALSRRGVAPHIYESSEEAHKHLHDIERGWSG